MHTIVWWWGRGGALEHAGLKVQAVRFTYQNIRCHNTGRYSTKTC